MIVRKPINSPTFVAAADGLLALHRLMCDGRDETPEGERIRDALDPLLKALDADEKRRLQWLSEDLYSTEDSDSANHSNGASTLDDAGFQDALREREWDRALSLLRDRKGLMSGTELSHRRGLVWFAAGLDDVALEFVRHATRSDPSNALYRSTLSNVMTRIASAGDDRTDS